MSHYSHFKAVTLILLLSFIMCLSGCVIGTPEEPYFEDRTTGWRPNLTLKAVFNIDDLDAEDSDLWAELIDFIPFTYSESVTDKNFGKAADEAMAANLGSSFTEIGKAHKTVVYENAIGFINSNAAVVFDPNTGRLKFCADLTKTDALKEQNGNLLLSVNAAELTSAQLEEIQNAAGWEDASQKVDLTDVTLPLTAQGAYDLSVAMDVRSWNGSSRLASTGGAFRVYWSDTSGAFFVVTNTYIQAFEASTGKLLLMHSYGKIRSNEYPYGKDDSVIE